MKNKTSSLISIENLTGLSDPLCKLIDVCANGISALAAPMLYSKMERAKRESLEKNARVNNEITIKNAIAEQLREKIVVGRDRREIQNMAEVIGLSADLIKCLSSVSTEPVDPDWSARFFDNVKNCSDEQIKTLWAQILAGEIVQPGRFSLRTLDMLKNMSKNDAKLIVKHSYRITQDALATKDMPAMDLVQLGDIGFISENSLIHNIKLEKDTRRIVHQSSSHVLIVHDIRSNGRTYIDVHALTQAGRELSSLLEKSHDDLFMHNLAKEIVRNAVPTFVKVSLYKIIDTEETSIIYNDEEPLWTEETFSSSVQPS